MVQIKTFLAFFSLAFGMVASDAAHAQLRGEPNRSIVQAGEDPLNERRADSLVQPLTAPMIRDIDFLLGSGIEGEQAYDLAKSADDIYSMCMMLGYSHEEAIDTVKTILWDVVLEEDAPEGEGIATSLIAAGSVIVGAVLLGSYAIADAIADYGDTWGTGSSDDGKEGSDEDGSDDGSDDGDSDGGSDDQGDDGVERESSSEKFPKPTVIEKPVFGPHLVTFD
ncbi:MAG: hypothetical protein CBE00_14015 [Planctomycetaceae bacterium TMED240]|nr:hypothetical protein [Rhodopirellula sp.]OUX03664.1 MAG: hypothetical protein CBE00_14015 [Planctomycetaceae bacterium TMED240]